MPDETANPQPLPGEVADLEPQEPEVVSRPLTAEERFYHEQSFKEPVESVARIEEAAKFLIGAAATTSGLFLAASKLAAGGGGDATWVVPFVVWAVAILVLILVLVPQRYPTGHQEPASWKAAFLEAQKRKYRRLVAGAALFVVGVLSAVVPLVS